MSNQEKVRSEITKAIDVLVAYILVVYKRQMRIFICHEQMTFAILG